MDFNFSAWSFAVNTDQARLNAVDSLIDQVISTAGARSGDGTGKKNCIPGFEILHLRPDDLDYVSSVKSKDASFTPLRYSINAQFGARGLPTQRRYRRAGRGSWL